MYYRGMAEKRKKKSFQNTFWSYLITIFVPVVIVGMVTVGVFFNKLARDTKTLNESVLEQSCNIMDSVLKDAMSVAFSLQQNETVKALIKAPSADIIDYYRVREIISQHKTNEAMDAVGLYLPGKDFLLDDKSRNTIAGYYQTYLYGTGQTPQWWEETFRGGITKSFYLAGQAEGGELQHPVIVYCQPMDYANRETGGVFVAVLNRDKLLAMVQATGFDEAKSFAIVNRQGDFIMRSDEFDTKIDEARLREEMGEFKSGTTQVLYRASQYTQLYYVYAFSGGGMSGNVNRFALLFVLLLCFGLMISLLLAKLEMSKIQKPFLSVFHENHRLTESLNAQMEEARNQVLVDLLLNVQINGAGMQEIRTPQGLGLQGERLLVAVAGFEQTDSVDVYDVSEETWQSLEYMIVKSLEQRKIAVRCVHMTNTMAFVMAFNQDTDAESALKTLARRCREQLDSLVSFGVGGTVSSLGEIWCSYDGAMPALRYALEEQPGEVIWFRDVKVYENDRIYYTNEKEIALIRNIKTGAGKKVTELLDEIYRMNFCERRLMDSSLKRLIANMTLTVYRIVDDVFDDDKENHEKYGRICQNLLQNKNVEEAFKILREVCLALSGGTNHKNGKIELKQRITDFLEKNYMRTDVSLDALATHMEMSYYYLSRLFKEVMGSNFATCLTALRMEKAKKLLDDEEQTVKEVAAQVGFSDSNSFIRAYKKYYQTTPGKH